MAKIMAEKDRELDREELLPLDPETALLAEGKRFTFDVVTTPSDPLR